MGLHLTSPRAYSDADAVAAVAAAGYSTLAATKTALVEGWEEDVVISPGNTVVVTIIAPVALTITAIRQYMKTAGTSAAGTYLLTIANAAGDNLLAAASYDLETIVSDTVTSLTLTATTSRLNIAAGAKVTFTYASNNADLTGGTGSKLAVSWVVQ